MSAVTVSSQSRVIGKGLTWEVVKSAAIAALIAGMVSLAVFLVASWQGWLDAVNGPVIIIDEDPTTIAELSVNVTWFALPAGAAAVTAFVMAIVLAASWVRIPIAHGATRQALVNGHLGAGVIASAVITLFGLGMAVLDHITGAGRQNSIVELFGLDGGVGGVLLGTLQAFGLLAGVYAFGLAIGIVFIRFSWWVGVGALIFLVMVLPALIEWAGLPWLDSYLVNASGMTWLDLIGLVLSVAAFAWMVRTLEVD